MYFSLPTPVIISNNLLSIHCVSLYWFYDRSLHDYRPSASLGNSFWLPSKEWGTILRIMTELAM